MKTLEQLGISPTPWSVDNYNNIRTDDGHTLAATVISNAYGLDRTEVRWEFEWIVLDSNKEVRDAD